MRKKLIVLLCFFIAAVIACSAVIISRKSDSETASEEYGAISETVTEASAAPASEEPYVSPIDFEALWEINPDVIGWIRIPGTDVDFPIMFSEDDNSYYLTHNIYGEELTSASIYIEYYNHTDFSDFNTVIYGHNMNDGSMFGQLHRYEDREFFDENRTVYIYLPDKTLTYEIFAARFVSNDHILRVCKNSDPESCEAYLEGIFTDESSDANIDENVNVTSGDNIITLSTCDRYRRSEKFVIHAVLIE